MAAQVISRSQFQALLGEQKGATVVGLTVRGSDPARYKADAGRITKTSYFSTMINALYNKAKAKRLGIDVDSLPPLQPCTWKERIEGSPLSRHVRNGTVYVEALYLSGHADYTLDGKPCDKSTVADMLKPSRKKEDKGKDTLIWITPKVDNIIGARIGGVEYVVIDD